MPNSSDIVALTGGIGSGKSTVAELFAQCGVRIIDTDAISHDVTGAGGRALAPICREFGTGALGPDGGLDRGAMRARVFADAASRVALEAILHPIIREEVIQALDTSSVATAPYVMLAVPLFFENMGFRGLARRTLVVDCPVELQRSRVGRRPGLAAADIDRILAAQITRPLRLQLADDVVSNAGTIVQLLPQISHFHARYVSMATSAW